MNKFKPDEKKIVERTNFFTETVDKVPNRRFTEHYFTGIFSKTGVFLTREEETRLPSHLRSKYKQLYYDKIKEMGEEAMWLGLNYNEKVPLRVKLSIQWKNRPNGPRNLETKKLTSLLSIFQYENVC